MSREGGRYIIDNEGEEPRKVPDQPSSPAPEPPAPDLKTPPAEADRNPPRKKG